MENNLYIFQYVDNTSFKKSTSITVIFLHQEKYENQNHFSEEIKEFFQTHSLSDKLVVIIPAYSNAKLLSFFTTLKDETFKRVPSKGDDYFDSNYFVYKYDELGLIKSSKPIDKGSDKGFMKNLLRHGSTQIFIKRGGLVESSADHHFIFPSNKHCSKFIRTGNILINSNEIFFIAFQLLPFFTKNVKIYCDTSSINVIPFALVELKRRFKASFNAPIINSFESYSVFESRKTIFGHDDLIIVSASTSGNIIDRMLQNQLAEKHQILVLFFIGPKHKYNGHASNILCDLTKNEDFVNGIPEFETADNETTCSHCKNYSRAIPIKGDVFLTVQPKVAKIDISAKFCAPKFLNEFISNYRSNSKENSLIRTYHKEDTNPSNNYEIFIDTIKLFTQAKNFKKYSQKFKKLVNTNIPANIKYLVYLPDIGSKTLAEKIASQINCSTPPDLVHIDEMKQKIKKNTEGSVVIVASSIVTGRHLLHISRSLRAHDKISIIYFVGIIRTVSEAYSKALKTNLNKGSDSSDFRPVVCVEEIFCSNEKYNSTWKQEKDFWESMLGNMSSNGVLHTFATKRREQLLLNRNTTGFSSQVFLPKYNNKPLLLRKGFAFWDFPYKESKVAQSEIYFTISSVLHNMEQMGINSPYSLQQSHYVRNILNPDTFYRYNDGILQAAILRAAKPESLAFDLDMDASLKMRTLIESMIDTYKTEHGEGLLEFFLAIGLKKLRLKIEDQNIVLEYAAACKNLLVSELAKEILIVLKRDSQTTESNLKTNRGI